MGILRNIFGSRQEEPQAVRREAEVVVENTSVNQSSARVDIFSEDALGITAYLRGLDIIASQVARVPFEYYKRQDGVLASWEASPFHYLLTVQPQEKLSAYEWRYRIAWQMKHDGQAFVFPRYVGADISELVLLTRGSCTYEPYSGLYNVTDFENRVTGVFDESEIIHLRTNTHGMYNGTPIADDACKSLSIAATASNEMHNRLGNGGNVKGIISNETANTSSPIGYKSDNLNNVAASVDRLFRNGRNIGYLPSALRFLQISQTAADMQFMDAVKYYSVDEIARLLGIPGYFLNENTGSNYKSVDEAYNALMQQTIDPILCQIESEFQRKLVGRTMCHKRVFRFDRDAMTTLDYNARARYMQATIAAGVYSINDWRKKLNQPAVDGGDTVLVSTNMASVSGEKIGGEETDKTEENG